MLRRLAFAAIVSFGLVLLGSPQLYGQSTDIRVYGGYYTESSDLFLGGGLGVNVLMLTVVPNFEYVFLDKGTFYTANLDGHLDILPLPGFTGWLGGGFAYIFAKPENGESVTRGGFNLIAGFGADVIPLSPFIQAKYVFTNKNQFVIAIGIRL